MEDKTTEVAFNSLSRDHTDDEVRRSMTVAPAFNSLSRDHAAPRAEGKYGTSKSFQLPLSGSPAAAGSTTPTRLHISFNSLSRDHAGRKVEPIIFRDVPFNSLSRDHLAKRKSTTIDVDSRFQLPLSGSPASSYHFLHPKTSKTAFNSLSRDHHAPSYRPAAWGHSADFQLPLSGSPQVFHKRATGAKQVFQLPLSGSPQQTN